MLKRPKLGHLCQFVIVFGAINTSGIQLLTISVLRRCSICMFPIKLLMLLKEKNVNMLFDVKACFACCLFMALQE